MGNQKDEESGAMLVAVQTGAEGDGRQDVPTPAPVSSESEPQPDSENLSHDNDKSGEQLTIEGLAEQHIEAYDGFDPSKHAVNPDGTPRVKADGSYALKRGRKATTAAGALPPKSAARKAVAGDQGAASLDAEQITSDMAAQQHANLLINAACWTMGEEVGRPSSKDEAQMLKLSFKNYYEVAGVPNIPPVVGLIFGIVAYLGPRMIHEQTLSRFEKAKLWFRLKFTK